MQREQGRAECEGGGGGGAAYSHDDEGNDALRNVVIVYCPDLPLAFAEPGVGFGALFAFFREFLQERQNLIVQFLGTSTQGVCTSRVVTFGVCSYLKTKIFWRLTLITVRVIM